MKHLLLLILFIIALCGLVIGIYAASTRSTSDGFTRSDIQRIVANSRSETPQSGLASDWFECRERYALSREPTETKVLCKTWSVQGVRSTLYMLTFGGEQVPVIESRLEAAQENGPLIIDVNGGPGGEPYHVNPAATEEFIGKLREKNPSLLYDGLIAREMPEYQLMQRGFTIASLGYWGMRFRTLNEPNEIDLAVRDVRLALTYYRDQLGKQPPLITKSLGNHLVLGAIGKEGLENTETLAIVPLMDGLQHHVERFRAEMLEAEEDEITQGLTFYNIYSRSEDGLAFDHSRALLSGDFATQFFGDSDLNWRDVSITAPCSKLVLASDDPRTTDYLTRMDHLPSFIEVWRSDHDVFRGAPDMAKAAPADFADCLSAQNRLASDRN